MNHRYFRVQRSKIYVGLCKGGQIYFPPESASFISNLSLSGIIYTALWDRIDSSRMKGMTPKNSFQSKEKSLKKSITQNRLIGILRTGWIKTACRSQYWRQYELICSYENQSRYHKCSINALSSWKYF